MAPKPSTSSSSSSEKQADVISAGSDPVIYPKHLPTHVRLSFLDEQEKRSRNPRDPSPPLTIPEVCDNARMLCPYSEHKSVRDREYFTRLLETAKHDVTKASLISGLSIPSVYRHLALAGIATKRR